MAEIDVLPMEQMEGLKDEDVLDDDDYTDMPDLCDKVDSVKEAAAAADADILNDEVIHTGGELGVWEDVLGSGRLMKKVIVEGSGNKPTKGDRVKINFQESFEEYSEILKDEKDYEFNVGENEVLQALDLIVPLMLVGETALIQSEGDFLYGSVGDSDRVPGSCQMFIRVDLISCHRLAAPPDLSIEERDRIGNEKRLRGNDWYTRQEYSQAIQCYRKAVEYLDDESIDSEVEVPIDRFLLPKPVFNLLEARVKAFNNMAQAQMKLGAWDSALSSIRQALKIEPNNEKALFRKALIVNEKCKTEEAIGVLRRVSRLYPENKKAKAELNKILAKYKKGLEKEQTMSKKMLEITDLPPLPRPSSRFNTDLWRNHTKLILACVGGIGALLGAIVAKTYQMY